ncbi:hypothetical protein GCM10010497_59850 [Streptomyces cinereoruber]|uniref:Uncharacterized protein n=1 Tax=Streptomyces cinereoruber TaxID=67260 RepID=A0AAV4KSX4_9ACTN|nr:hypothetical protein GCM10010497_59850 [Streptomyces cinereoruber]
MILTSLKDQVRLCASRKAAARSSASFCPSISVRPHEVVGPRFGPTVDQTEADALKVYKEACEITIAQYNPAL